MMTQLSVIDYARIAETVNVLEAGGIIAYPTEAVWGLGADPFNQSSVERILALKQRRAAKGLILISDQVTDFLPLIRHLPLENQKQIIASWPGETTWVIPDPEQVFPRWIKGQHSSVAVRVTRHPLVAELCRQFGGPLVSTSANRSQRPPARTSLEARCRLGRYVDHLLVGPTLGLDKPSTIIDAVSLKKLR